MTIRSDRDVRASGEPARMAIAAMGGHLFYVAQLRAAARGGGQGAVAKQPPDKKEFR